MMIDNFVHFQHHPICVKSHVHNSKCCFNGRITSLLGIFTNNEFSMIFTSMVFTDKLILDSSRGVFLYFVVVHDSLPPTGVLHLVRNRVLAYFAHF